MTLFPPSSGRWVLLATVLGVVGLSPTGYGQLVRNASQGVLVEERRQARDGHDDHGQGSSHAPTEPDARFTLANERTFLAWNRTALALVVAGLGIVQLLPPFPGVPWGRHVLGLPLIALGAAVSVISYREWRRTQAALRDAAPLPRSVLPRVLAGTIAGIAALSAAVLLVSATR
jgi:putative membrane protein